MPAVISYPAKLPKGVVRDQVITGADWFPTILELCGVATPNVELDGQSLTPIIKSAKAKSHHKVMHWGWSNKWAVRDGDWKLLGAKGKVTHLVNLADAEPERKNYLKEKPELAERLRRLHDEWLEETRPGKR